MGSVNRVTLVGHLGNDAKMSKTTNGNLVASFNMATNESWKNKNGDKEKRTEWHRIVLWGTQAETLTEYLTKGRQIYVEGRIQSSKWEKDDVKHTAVNIVAETIKFLDPANRETREAS